MLLPPTWTAADNVEVAVWLADEHRFPPILAALAEFAGSVERAFFFYLDFKHTMFGRCTHHMVVMHNTDETISRFKNNEIDVVQLCTTCRGKGHPWKCEIWNGKPYLGKPAGDHWTHPDRCPDCKGKAVLGPLTLLAKQSEAL